MFVINSVFNGWTALAYPELELFHFVARADCLGRLLLAAKRTCGDKTAILRFDPGCVKTRCMN
jgi:hypothetical protein